MTGIADVLVYAGFLATPLGGFAVLQLLLRTGLFTAGTERRNVPLVSTTGEYFTFESRLHRVVVVAGFFAGWFTALGGYIFLVDAFYFGSG